jgi:hypothetical protein
MNIDYTGLTVICADEGQGKSTMGLTWPKPLLHMDLDLNGFNRARWRFKDFKIKELEPGEQLTGKDIAAYDIISKPYPRAIQLEKLLGPGSEKSGGNIQIRFAKKVEGMLELWQQMAVDFVAACQQPLLKTIMFDTGTSFYQIATQSHLQFLQEKQIAGGVSNPNELREKLQKMEYTPVNEKCRQFLWTGKSFKKNMVFTCYPKDVYADTLNANNEVVEYRTGAKKEDGFSELTKLADLVVWVAVEQNGVGTQAMAQITKCGIEEMGFNAVGRKIGANYKALVELKGMMKAEALMGGLK